MVCVGSGILETIFLRRFWRNGSSLRQPPLTLGCLCLEIWTKHVFLVTGLADTILRLLEHYFQSICIVYLFGTPKAIQSASRAQGVRKLSPA